MSLTSFLRGSALFQGLTKPKILSVDKWAMMHANRCTPDDIIAAHYIELIAREFDNFKLIHRYSFQQKDFERFTGHPDWCLVYQPKAGRKFPARIFWKTSEEYKDRKSIKRHHNFEIDKVKIDEAAGNRIVAAYKDVEEKWKVAKEAAKKAAEELAINEAKWNLAERLLGMKRNEHGALVPIQTAE